MTKFQIFLAVSIFTAQGSVLRSYGTLKRVARSPCNYCGHDHHGLPTPPQPDFHAQQWTGFLKSADGSQQGVFSGAAASTQYDTQSVGQAYSLSGAGSNSAIHPVDNAGSASASASAQPAALLQGYQTKSGGNAVGSGQSSFGSQANAGESGLASHLAPHRDAAGVNSVGHGFAYGSQGNGGANTFGSGQSSFGSQAYSGAHAAESRPSSSSGSSGSAGVQSMGNGFAYGSQGKERANDFGPGQSSFGSQANSEAHAAESRPSSSSGSSGSAGVQSLGNGFAYGSQGNDRANDFGPGKSSFGSQSNYGAHAAESRLSSSSGSSGSAGVQSIGNGFAYGSQGNDFGPGRSSFGSQKNSGAHGHESRLSSGSEGRGDIGVPSLGNGFAYGSQGNEEANAFGPGQSSFGSQVNAKTHAAESGPSSSFGSHREAGINSVGNGFAYGSQRNGRDNAFGSRQSGFESQTNAGPNSVSSYGTQPNSVEQSGGYGSQANGGANAAASEQSGGHGSSYGEDTKSHQSAQSALDGALGLARQGLQADQAAGCSTCGKTNYAFSNAKTHSGNAIALSVNG